LTLLFGFSLENINAQNDYNKTDNQGRRQGKWIDFHDNGKIRYTGEFKNNEPIGEFLYYSEEGVLIAKNNYLKKSNITETEMYAANGKVIAKGKYQDKKKHDKWEYFSEETGALILTENYENGMIVGKSVAYSSTTQMVIEEIEYVNGMKNGVSNRYYDNGRIMEKANYQNDKLNGDYSFYYPNGVVKEEGKYLDNQKVGEWKTYDMEEGLLSVDVYSEI
jgi:antitoxin component YwqK of YwqJK toxin-antitoxin module